MKKGQKVRVVDHEAYEGIHRVGDEGEIKEIKEEAVFVLFDGEEGAIEYPLDVIKPVDEKPAEEEKPAEPATEQATPDAASWEARIKAAGGDPQKKREIVDAMVSELGVGRMDAGNILDRVQSGEPFERAYKSETGAGEAAPGAVAPGAQPAAARPIGRRESTKRRKRVKEQEEIKRQVSWTLVSLPGLYGTPEELENAAVDALEGVDISVLPTTTYGPRREKTESSKIFCPISVNVLEQGDKEDEYVSIGEGSAVRSEYHLVRAIRSAVRSAMESMERPFDVVDVVFRRAPVQEQKRRKAERELIASLHLLDEGKAKSADVRRAAQKAAKLGVKTARLESFTDDRYAKKILKEAMTVGGSVKIIWPPKELSKHLGQHVIVETRTGDRLVGSLTKGPGRTFQIKTKSGTHRFGMSDVTRILVKPGAK